MPAQRNKATSVAPVAPAELPLPGKQSVRGRRRVRFTDVLLRSLKPRAERYEIIDTVTRGLRLRVSPSGEKVFSAVYKRPGGQVPRFTIGVFGDAEDEFTLAAARKKAATVAAQAQLGQDAQREKLEARSELRAALDFEDLAGRFVEDREPNLAPSTAREYRRQIKTYLHGSRVAAMIAKEVRRGDLRETLEAVARQNGPVMANRYFQLLRAVCRWALREDLLDANPADGIQRPRKEASRERTLTDAEVVALWRGLEAHELEDGTEMAAMRPDVAAAVRVLLLLGQRSTETIEMRWSDLDLEAAPATWTIPGAFRKGGRLHVVPVSPAAKRILQALPQAGPRVFAGVYEANAERDWWGTVRDRAVVLGAERFTKHDLRRTCATGCAKLGASDFTVSRILGHAVLPGVQVSRVYNRYEGLPEMASALNAWGHHVSAIVKGRRSKIVPMARA